MKTQQVGVRRRDDFPQNIKQKLAARSGYLCSNPDCRASTSGPQLSEEKAVNVGVASHISGAAPLGPRYNSSLTPRERAGIKNGIWLCQICAKLIDADEDRYSIIDLLGWKTFSELEAHRRIGKSKPAKTSPGLEREIKRELKVRDDLRKGLLKTPLELAKTSSARPGPFFNHPYERFGVRKVIIRRLGDETYPQVDESPGISSWFKLELYDFYHGGIKVILGIDRGVIGRDQFYAGKQPWAVISHGADFDRTRFIEIKIWSLGLIPFKNIRHYDLHGDEYYGYPHLYCAFSNRGEPYAGFEHAVLGGENEYDWHLDPELRVQEATVQVGSVRSSSFASDI